MLGYKSTWGSIDIFGIWKIVVVCMRAKKGFGPIPDI